jgi:TMEM175 potassium channel family protein
MPLPISIRRIEAFTDGVFAIASTLLVLDLAANRLTHVVTNDDLWQGLVSMGPSFLSFGVSFALLTLLWSIHVRQFEFIASADRRLVTMNSARLLFVVLIPFTTSLNGDYSDLTLGRILLPINFACVVLMGTLQWHYVTTHPHLVRDLSLTEARRGLVAGWIAAGISVAVIPLAYFVGSAAFLLFAFNAVLNSIFWRLKLMRT